MSYNIYIEGALTTENPTKGQLEAIGKIKAGSRLDRIAFAVNEFEDSVYNITTFDHVEGLNPKVDYIDEPLEKLVKILGSNLNGTLYLTSDLGDYDNIIVEITDGVISETDGNVRNASTEVLIKELSERQKNNEQFSDLAAKTSEGILIDELTGELTVCVTGNITDSLSLLLGGNDNIGLSVIIDPALRIATKLHACRYDNGVESDVTIAITKPYDQVNIFFNIDESYEGSTIFEEALKEGLFIVRKDENIRWLQAYAGYMNANTEYGPDIDELDFAMMISERGIEPDFIEEVVGKDMADWYRNYAPEHGLM